MTGDSIRRAEEAAKRFLALAKEVRKANPETDEIRWISPSKQSGALRRASMDLTRLLADMRRP